MDRWKRCCASRNLWVLDFGNKRFCMGRRSAEYLSIGNAGGRGSSWSTSRNLVIDRWPGSSDLNGEAARGTLWARAGGGASRNVCWLPLAPGAHFDHAQALPRRQPRRPTSAGPDGGRPQRRGADCSVSAEAKNRKRRTPVRRWAPAAGRRGPRTRAPRARPAPRALREGGRAAAPGPSRSPGPTAAAGRGLREGAGPARGGGAPGPPDVRLRQWAKRPFSTGSEWLEFRRTFLRGGSGVGPALLGPPPPPAPTPAVAWPQGLRVEQFRSRFCRRRVSGSGGGRGGGRLLGAGSRLARRVAEGLLFGSEGDGSPSFRGRSQS